MTSTKDRSMATGPYPARFVSRKVVVETTWSGGSYRTHVTGRRGVVILSDGSEILCSHVNGHKRQDTLVACATRLVRELNDAVGIPRDAQ